MVRRERSVYKGQSFKELLDDVPDEATLHSRIEYYGEEVLFFEWEEEESDASWNRRLKLYEKRMEKYNAKNNKVKEKAGKTKKRDD
jgi:hypothetical protein